MTLLFAAIGVVVQLKEALNTVWEVEAKRRSGVWGFVRDYVVSLAGVLAVGFLLLISLVMTAGLAAMGKYMGGALPEPLMQALGFGVSFLSISAMFAMIFKWMPDAVVDWQDVIVGAVGTAALFEIGKFAIGLYIGKQGLESSYGASASIVVVLICGFATFFVGLAVALPVLAYATWHAYRDLIAAEDRLVREPASAVQA